jgi:glycosyltransferase involved in cell wall biosynthesis
MSSIWIISQNSGTPNLGGVQRHYFFAKEFEKNNISTTIISCQKNHLYIKEPKMGIGEIDGVNFLQLTTFLSFSKGISRFFQMFEFAVKVFFLPFYNLKKPDVIILSSMSIFPLPAVLFLKKYYGAKFIFELRDLWPLTPIHLKGVSKNNVLIKLMFYLEKLAFKKADHIVSTLEESRSYIDSISNRPNKLKIIPNGTSSHYIQNKLKINKGNIKIVYAGSFGIANALDPLIQFLEKNKFPENVEFHFYGDGYEKQQVEEKLKGLKNIFFNNKIPRDRLIKILPDFDFGYVAWHNVSLYDYGVSGQKYYDYMASGLPILSASGKIKDSVYKFGCGLQFENNSKAIENGILKISKMKRQDFRLMGQKGLDQIQNYTYENLAKNYIAIFNNFE